MGGAIADLLRWTKEGYPLQRLLAFTECRSTASRRMRMRGRQGLSGGG